MIWGVEVFLYFYSRPDSRHDDDHRVTWKDDPDESRHDDDNR